MLNDSVEGLAMSAPITLNGLVIGKVTVIKINLIRSKLMVKCRLKLIFQFQNQEIRLRTQDLLGKQIAIEPNFQDKNLAEDGQLLITNVRMGLTESIENKLGPIQVKLEKNND
jgi:phospholipid/cholesterol/gamma-HCH transport system substrate-binding protein